ncbi:MAG TPA: hypothetical protein VFQ90_11530, partial [Stellaceae bacterium]|nr:hypothetical protein [Stellaceae bacterium]
TPYLSPMGLVARQPVAAVELGNTLAQHLLGPLQPFLLVAALARPWRNCLTSAETGVPRSAATIRA